MKALQTEFAMPKVYESTFSHEMYHWSDAETYRTKVGVITNSEENQSYIAWIRESR